MDRSVQGDDTEPFYHLSSSSSSPALAYLSTHTDHPTTTTNKQQSQGFDSSAQDVLAGYDFHASTQPRRRTFSVEHISSRRHRSSGSPVYLAGELISARKDAEMDSHSSKIVSAVDRTIKKYGDNILRVLEGMNGRLSHLESVTQVLENSVKSLKVSVDDYHNEANARSKALNNHVSEMHRAVQILRDKQDIVETNAELAKLQTSKAEVVREKATNQPVVSSQIVIQEQLNVVSNLVPKRPSTELQVSSQHLNEVSEQFQQLSVSADVHALPQQLIPMQARTPQLTQQLQVLSHSELLPTLQPRETIQSGPGVFQAQSQHVQTQQIVQPQQGGVFQAQAQQSLQLQQGVFQSQQQHVQPQQSFQSQQGTFQAQPQHMPTQQSVQLQQELFQAQQQQMQIQQNAQSQDGALQAQQLHVLAQPTLPIQQGAFQSQAHHVQPQQGIQVPQGVFQAQPSHVQIQQRAQSQQGAFQSQQQHSQTQQNIQSQQGVIQAQSQQLQTQQSFQSHQAQLFQGPQQQFTQPPSQPAKQTATIMSHAEQAQVQAVSQHLNIQQPVVGQPSSVHIPSTQFGLVPQILQAQQLLQVQPTLNSYLQYPQNYSPSQSMGGQVITQPANMQQTPSAHVTLQGVPPGQGSFQGTQQNESFSRAPLSQATVMQLPSSQVDYNAGSPHNVSNTGSSQQHHFSSQPLLLAQASNPYHRIPSPLQGPQPVYVSQMARPAVSSAISAGALPVAQNVYNQSPSGGSSNPLSRDNGIIEKVAAMGFSRDEVRSAIKRLTDQGQIVDMNAVLNSLMNGRNQPQRGWQAG